MLVDDEPFIIRGLKRLIDWDSLGLAIVAEASYGTEALKLLEENPVDILITDIRMPFMNGLELMSAMRERCMNTKMIVLSGFDDFSYVKEAARLGIENYILKPVSADELISTLENTIRKLNTEHTLRDRENEYLHILRDHILYRWVGNDISESDFMERAAVAGLSPVMASPLVVVARCRRMLGDKPPVHLAGLLSVVCGERYSPSVFVTPEKDVCAILQCACEESYHRLLQIVLPSFLRQAETNPGVYCYIGIGSMEQGFEGAARSYAHALHALDFHLLMPDRHLFEYAALTEDTWKDGIEFDFTHFETVLSQRNKEEAQTMIEKLFTDIHSSVRISPDSIRGIVAELCVSILRLFKTRDDIKPGKLPDARNILNGVLAADTADNLRLLALGLLEECSEYLHEEYSSYSNLTRHTVDYIQKNFTSAISLSMIAELLGTNPNYLGQVFHDETGETFNNYLNRLRIDKAKELLRSTTIKANAIADKIGYVNANYFYTVFKKMTGMPISEFKRPGKK